MMQLISGRNIAITSNVVELIIPTHIPTFLGLEITAYLLSQTNQKVRDDQDMIFYSQTINTCTVQTATKTEKVLILGEIYKHKEQWKFRFIDQGFNDGLKPLAENFVVEIAN